MIHSGRPGTLVLVFLIEPFPYLTDSFLTPTLLTAGDSDLLESSLCLRTIPPASACSGPFLVGDTSAFIKARRKKNQNNLNND